MTKRKPLTGEMKHQSGMQVSLKHVSKLCQVLRLHIRQMCCHNVRRSSKWAWQQQQALINFFATWQAFSALDVWTIVCHAFHGSGNSKQERKKTILEHSACPTGLGFIVALQYGFCILATL